MLLLASADTDSGVSGPPPPDMDTPSNQYLRTVELLYQDKGVCLKLDLPEASLPRIYGDENRLNRFLLSSWIMPCSTRQKTQCHCYRIRTDR